MFFSKRLYVSACRKYAFVRSLLKFLKCLKTMAFCGSVSRNASNVLFDPINYSGKVVEVSIGFGFERKKTRSGFVTPSIYFYFFCETAVSTTYC